MKNNGVTDMLNRKSPKVIQINDVIDWYTKDEIVLSPNYQRNSVWNEKAKSYLIDTILRGLPMPPIFLRQTIDTTNRKTNREIIDGQQRLRTIIEFVNDKFKVLKSHNEIYGGLLYSQLDDDVKLAFLEYEFFAEIINDFDDTIIYDMFARLNTNNCVLNKQELRNAKYWGDFKVASYNIAADFRKFFEKNKIFTDKQFTRMLDVEFISTLLMFVDLGIEDDKPSNIDKYYQKYDKNYTIYNEIVPKLTKVFDVLDKVYCYFNGVVNCFDSKVYFYTLFAVTYNQMFGINNIELKRNEKFNSDTIYNNIDNFIKVIIDFENLFIQYVINNSYSKDDEKIYLEFQEFAKFHKIRTTNKNERLVRISFLNDFFIGE